MTKVNSMALAVMAICVSSSNQAFELGEFNGTKFSIGGYIKTEAISNNPDEGESSLDTTTRQSRLNFKTEKNLEGHKIVSFVEGDFYGSNASSSSYEWRLRHATISIDDHLTIGQTWNGQTFAVLPYEPGMINFYGFGTGTIGQGGAVGRPTMVVHYKNAGFDITAQDPAYDQASVPDLVASYSGRLEGGHTFGIALAGREIETTTDHSDFGVSIQVGGKVVLGKTSLHASAFTGTGQAIYASYGYNGAAGSSTSDVNADGDLITTSGYMAAISQKFTDKLRGTARYGQVTPDETADSVEEKLRMTTVTLMYSWLPGVDFGAEWRDQNVTTIPTSRPAGQQVEVMAMYKF